VSKVLGVKIVWWIQTVLKGVVEKLRVGIWSERVESWMASTLRGMSFAEYTDVFAARDIVLM